MIEPKELALLDQKGNTRNFLITKIPAIAAREIVAKYPVANLPKVGDYGVSEEVMLKAMAFVWAVPATGDPIQLTTRALVDNHVGDWETLGKLEYAMLEYNVSFLPGGQNFDFFESISQKAVTWITQTLIPSLDQSLQAAKQASSTSKPN